MRRLLCASRNNDFDFFYSVLAGLRSAGSHCFRYFRSAIPQAGGLLELSKRNQNHGCAKRTTVSALRKVRKQKRAATSVKKRGRFACKPASGARFSTAKCRSRESDMRMVLRRFCHQKRQTIAAKTRSIGNFCHQKVPISRTEVQIRSYRKTSPETGR